MLFNPTFYVFITSVTASVFQGRSSVLLNDTHPSNVYGQGEPRVGWTESPDTRGTLDILWSCVFTSFICCWSILCINVPSKNATAHTQFKRKCLMAVTTLLAPEVISVTALGQYVSAWRSVKDFAAAGLSGWTMRHAFFADMGGFVLQPRDWMHFPINAKQLLWLVEHGYVAMPQVDAAVIRDKNKANGFMRLITAVQITWFCVNIVGRLAQRLAITVIEVTTVAFIYCALFTMFFWRHKPADVETAETLHTNATMKEILVAGGESAREPYRQTPLDFASRREWAWSRYLAHFQNATVARFRSRIVPIDHISSMTTPEIPFWIFRLGTLAVIGYCCLFVPPWNSSFPTRAEQILWRIATVGNLGSLVGGELLTDWIFFIWPFIKKRWGSTCEGPGTQDQESLNYPGRQQRSPGQQESPDAHKTRIGPCPKRTLWDKIRNNSPSNDPHLTLPLKAILPVWVFVVIYLVSRAYIVVEDFIELRSLPLSAFKNVEWSGLFPHV